MKQLLYRLESLQTGQIIIDELTPEVFAQVTENLATDGNKKINSSGKPAKVLRLSNATHRVFAFSDNKDYVKSNRRIKTEAELMLAVAANVDAEIQRSKARAENQTRRLIHNLKSLSAKTAQEVFYIGLQTNLMESPRDSLSYLERQVAEHPHDTAKALLSILKHTTAQNTEFLAFNKLNGSVAIQAKESHKLHKVLMNVFYLFFQEFSDKNVLVRVEETNLQGVFDYDSIHVCIYHLVENAAKYIRSNSNFSVSTKSIKKEVHIVFEMESLLVHEDELEKIFDEGVSGQLSVSKGLQGEGIGLYVARSMATMNGGQLVLLNGTAIKGNPEYARNKFTLTVPIAT